MVTVPWRAAEPLSHATFAQVRRRTIFECCKWDPQVEDVSALAAFPVVMRRDAWDELTVLAEALARESLAAEEELRSRPDLHRALSLPRRTAAALARAGGASGPAGAARLVRFDFHHTAEGWRISEANTDVPGGLNEASGFAALVAEHYRAAVPVGDAAGVYASALADAVAPGAHAALVHATAYTDDRQVMTYLARRLEALGVRASLVSPADLRWRRGHAYLAGEWGDSPVDLIVRFFPAEWLPNLPGTCGWMHFFHGARTPISNPATALLTQSKRFPLVWDALRTPLPAWRALLPETRDPRDCDWRRDEAWVVKPVFGRVGEDVGIPGVTAAKEWSGLARDVGRHPRHWIAQRRFEPTALVAGDTCLHPCIGVYTVNARVAGAYGRLGRLPLIDWRAQDVAVLVEREERPGIDAPAVTLERVG